MKSTSAEQVSSHAVWPVSTSASFPHHPFVAPCSILPPRYTAFAVVFRAGCVSGRFHPQPHGDLAQACGCPHAGARLSSLHLPRPGARAISTAAANGQTPADVEEAVAHADARPFVKWAGGKTQIVGDLLALAPASIDTYYEPFVGGGALFFRLAADPDRRPRRAVLSDLNAELMATFRAVRDDVEPLIGRLEGLQRAYLDLDDAGREARYYELREEYRALVGGDAADLDTATLLIFLNKTCFNGLFYSRSGCCGRMCVPWANQNGTTGTTSSRARRRRATRPCTHF
ncbi:MAG: hypothetical protein F4X26_09870 [Chloroflexi bacterium]|nr:hypothetical protein [Chloroflexota bacterium]